MVSSILAQDWIEIKIWYYANDWQKNHTLFKQNTVIGVNMIMNKPELV